MEYTPKGSAEHLGKLVEALTPQGGTNIFRELAYGRPLEPLLSRNSEYVENVKRMVGELLNLVPITAAYRTEIISDLVRGYQAGVNGGVDVVLQSLGIHRDRGIWGIFESPQLAREIERFALQEETENFYSHQVMLAPDDYNNLLNNFIKFAGWCRKEFRLGPDFVSEPELTNEFDRGLDKIRAERDPQYQKLEAWIKEFQALYSEDPFSKEGQNPFEL